MIRLAFKTLTGHPYRFCLTACGIGACVILILFLMGIYKGVADGSVDYIRNNPADIWVLQSHANNILRSTSVLEPRHGRKIREIEGVSTVSPLLFILASVDMPDETGTLYLCGFDHRSGLGGPPTIVAGRNILNNGEIVLDRSFAAKHGIGMGDSLRIRNMVLQVVGISSGTNMFVIQYAFVTLPDAHRIIGIAGIVTCYQVLISTGYRETEVAREIENTVPGVAAIDQDNFLKNNMREMESGILPLLFTVAVLGSVVLSVILSLILTINVLERRTDYAIMKAIGSPRGYISGLVIWQSLILSFSGLVIGVALFFPVGAGVEILSPEVSLVTTAIQLVSVMIMVLLVSLLGTIVPNQKLKKVYPLEVFK